jgi:hypothetical protein
MSGREAEAAVGWAVAGTAAGWVGAAEAGGTVDPSGAVVGGGVAGEAVARARPQASRKAPRVRAPVPSAAVFRKSRLVSLDIMHLIITFYLEEKFAF